MDQSNKWRSDYMHYGRTVEIDFFRKSHYITFLALEAARTVTFLTPEPWHRLTTITTACMTNSSWVARCQTVFHNLNFGRWLC